MSQVRQVGVALLLLVALLAVACGDSGTVQWRDATITVPEGWHVFEEEETRLSISNVPLGMDADLDEIGDQGVVAMFFEHRPGHIPDDVRGFVDDRPEGTIESDEAIELDGVPATRIIYQHVSSDVTTREMVVVIPAREIAVLAQPVPSPGDEHGPEVFMEHLDTFLDVIESLEFGAPVDRR